MNWKQGLRILAAGIFLLLPWAADAQQVNMYWNTGGCSQFSCWSPISAANPLPITGSFSATTTGFPGTTQTTGTPISVTTGGVTGTLPAGTEVVASNVGSTNGAYCKLGASATTSDQLIPPNSWFGFTVGSNTQLTCITSTSTTTVNMVGGAGLPTGSGGGGGGGSGGNVTIVGPLGQQLAAASVPVVLTAAQITTLTPLTTVAVTQSTSPWIVAGGGTAGTAATGVVTVQGIAAMTPILATITGSLTANQSVNVNQWDGTALGVPTAYGTAPSTGNYIGVNAFVTNTNANGQATMANSSPVVIASNQSAVPVTLTSTTVTGNVAAIGSTAVGSANANPPVVIGGTATGAAGANVQGLSIVATSTAPVTATNTAVVVDLRPDSPGIITLGPAAPANAVPTIPSSPYPGNATAVAVPINASSGNVAAGTAAATLAAAASKFTYMSGFQFTSSGSTVGLPVVCTITGITTTKSYIVTSVAGVLLANAPLIVQFNPPLQSSAVNTAVVASCPSLGTGNTNAVMTADGYQL